MTLEAAGERAIDRYADGYRRGHSGKKVPRSKKKDPAYVFGHAAGDAARKELERKKNDNKYA